MAVNTAKVAGRRTLRFETLDELKRDVVAIQQAPFQTIGNWSLGQILDHLATSFRIAVDGGDFKPPWFVRLMAPWIKKGMLKNTMRPGFKLPAAMEKTFLPAAGTTTEAGRAAFDEQVRRFEQAKDLKPHSLFGPLTRDEWTRFLLRHAELHLSFVVPK